MNLNEQLKLVIPIYGDAADSPVVAWVHSTPISREVFAANYLLCAATFAGIHGEGLGELAGPKVAAYMLQDIAKRKQIDPKGLMNEIRRLTNVATLGKSGWELIPFHDAAQRSLISADDVAEVENALVFFTVASVMLPRQQCMMILPGAMKLWGAATLLLDCTAWLASLQTSTATESTGERIPPQPAEPVILNSPAASASLVPY